MLANTSFQGINVGDDIEYEYWTYADMNDLVNQIGIDQFLNDIKTLYPELYTNIVITINYG